MNYIIFQNVRAASTTSIADILSNGGADANFRTVILAIIATINLALYLAGSVGFIMIIYSSILYIGSFGDDAKVETAKKTLTWSIVGLVVVALSTIVVNFVDTALQ